MHNIDDQHIINAQEGSVEDFRQIYIETSPFIYTVILRIAGNESDAQDITQNVFIKVFKKLKSFKFKSSFKTWLYRIAVNEAINAINKRAYEKIS